MERTAASLKAQTKVYLGALMACGSLLQIREVNDFVVKLAHNHPHIISIVGTATGIATLLHDPRVQDVLGIKRKVTVETEEVVAIEPPTAAKE